jgi:hypothetical protein
MSKKRTVEFIKEEYLKEDYEFLDPEYKGNRIKYNIKCLKCGHIFKQKYNHFQQGQRCPKCTKAKIKTQRAHSLNFIQQEYSKRGYFYLDDFYNNAHELHNIKCLKHNIIWKQSYNYLQQSQGCPECTQEHYKQTMLRRYGVENPSQVKQFLDKKKKTRIKNGYQLEIKGLTSSELTKIYNISLTTILKYKHNYNPTDDELLEFLKNFSHNSMNMLEQQLLKISELTYFNKRPPNLNAFYKPDFKLNETTYVNTDGLYWHSECDKDNNYHFKMRECFERSNLRILQFREDEVRNKFPIIESMINNLQNKSIRIFARKTTVKEVSQQIANPFLDNNHLMGKMNAKHIGLYLNNELVSLISYKTHPKYLKIERFCSLIGHTIIGGFSKLLKQVESLNYKNLPIHYWVDLRYGTGKHLLNQGFLLDHETLGWKWTDGINTYNRLMCRANLDDRKLSEREYANERGWFKIYDAGQRLYIKGA